MTPDPTCACEGLDHPKEIFNPAGRDFIRYRVGSFADFRAALLRYDDDTPLRRWRPHAEADLAVQVVEWWAYLADVLTFYNERAASQAYLRTADRPESPARLVRVLGYRPRPGLAASGKVAALLTRPKAITLPKGFQVASKPGPGKKPQIFETTEAVVLQPPDAISVDPVSDGMLVQSQGSEDGVLLAGVIASLKPGDRVLLLSPSSSPASMYLTVHSARKVLSPRGQPNTRVVFEEKLTSNIKAAPVTGFQLVKAPLSAHLWPFNSDVDIQVKGAQTTIHLDGLTRQIKGGSRVLLIDTSNANAPLVPMVSSYQENIWIANTTNSSDPSQPGTLAANVYPIPIPHSVLTLDVDLSTWQTDRTLIEVRYQFTPVGMLIGAPAGALHLTSTTQPMVVATGAGTFPDGVGIPTQIQGGDGAGLLLTGSRVDPTHMKLGDIPAGGGELTTPLTVYFSLFDVSRGATVANEVLGSGDSTQMFQDFTLKKSPVTYFYTPGSASGSDFRSSVSVRVDQVEWAERSSFFNQLGTDQIFVTREDEQGRTHVVFGDGQNGARLPSGHNNVVATYRYGSGADSPDAGSLSVIMKPQPGLKALRNPARVGGGADPDSPRRLRDLAPRSVLALGRAVSADDFAVIASQAPGVSQARAYWTWDAGLSRSIVKVYVIGDAGAAAAAQAAVTAAADPNRAVRVVPATQYTVNLSLTLDVDPRYLPEAVRDSVAAALDDPDTGLFAFGRMRIGEPMYDSAIYNACLSVSGAIAVPKIQFAVGGGIDSGSRHNPGEGGYFALVPPDLRGNITTEVWTHGD